MNKTELLTVMIMLNILHAQDLTLHPAVICLIIPNICQIIYKFAKMSSRNLVEIFAIYEEKHLEDI